MYLHDKYVHVIPIYMYMERVYRYRLSDMKRVQKSSLNEWLCRDAHCGRG